MISILIPAGDDYDASFDYRDIDEKALVVLRRYGLCCVMFKNFGPGNSGYTLYTKDQIANGDPGGMVDAASFKDGPEEMSYGRHDHDYDIIAYRICACQPEALRMVMRDGPMEIMDEIPMKWDWTSEPDKYETKDCITYPPMPVEKPVPLTFDTLLISPCR